MELTKELQKKLEKAGTPEEVKDILEESGLELTDADLDQAAGGLSEELLRWMEEWKREPDRGKVERRGSYYVSQVW